MSKVGQLEILCGPWRPLRLRGEVPGLSKYTDDEVKPSFEFSVSGTVFKVYRKGTRDAKDR